MPVDPAKLAIVNYPASVLRLKAKPIRAVTDEIKIVALRMLQLMHEAPGVGLAAPQVGLSWRMFVANHSGEPGDDRVFINPVLSEPTRNVEDYEEGCLSLPEIRADIRRPKGITISALGLDGLPFTLTSDELPARIWQHETDHLDGVLIIDRMSPGDRTALRRKIKELEEAAA
jgi:peptide deformylase